MRPYHLGRVLVLAAPGAALLGACSTLSPQSHLPVPIAAACTDSFTTDYRVRATVSVQRRGAQEQYFLAIDSRPPNTEVNLISLQGIPIYRLRCINGTANELHLAQVPSALAPAQVVQYLNGIYLRNNAPQVLQSGWHRSQSSTQDINFHYSEGGETARQISIHTQGSAPWFESVQLTDDAAKITLAITVLEAHRVLPE